jgi:PAS domain S-box-containing protein
MERSKSYEQLVAELQQARDEIASLRWDGPAPAHRHHGEDAGADRRAARQDSHVDTSARELVDALKEAQRRILRLSEESHQFQHLVSSVINYAIFAMDLDGRIISWNPGAERMKLWKAEEIIGQHLRMLYLPPDRAAGRAEAHLREASERGFYQGEAQRMRKNGEIFEAFVSITPIFDEHGVHIGYSKVTQELTEQKRLEAHRSEIADMEQARVVREREVAEERIEALQEASAHKDDFLGILSHELRTPINAIMGFGSILDDEIPGPLNDEQHRFMRKILRGSEDLLSLINDLLDMSRIQAGKFTLEPQPMHFPTVAGEVLANLRPLAEQKQLTLSSALGDVGPMVADPQRIGQVLLNLVNNAIKFTPNGGAVTVRAKAENGQLYCEVADTGVGIAPADQPRLFKRFSQLDNSNTRSAKGTGLGLSISQALIEAHGGRIAVESEPGHGAKFWFTLPLVVNG